MEKKFVSVVIYLHNDEERIVPFLDKVFDVVLNSFEQYELVCVDDGCTDGTVPAMKEYMKKKEKQGVLSIVHMGFYQGIEAAMNAGRDASIGDFVYEFDSIVGDFDHGLIMELYETMLSGYDIVSASPSGKTRFTSRLFYTVFNGSSRAGIKLDTESFRILSRRAINRIKSMGAYIPYRKAVYASCGLRTTLVKYESTISPKERKQMKKKATNRFERSQIALDSFIYFTNIMEKLSAGISVLFLLLFLGIGVYSIVDYFVNGTAIEGWTSTVCLVAIGFFGIFIILTIILKYLSVLLDLVFKKQKYLVADIEKVVSQ